MVDVLDRENRPCELVDGTLVEKALGYEESEIALLIGTFLNNFVRPRKLGIVTGADGTIRLFPGLVRIPDVAFASWSRFPDRKRPKARIPHLAPDLVVEVLSQGNSKAEIAKKLGEYFEAGVRMVWLVDIRKQSVRSLYGHRPGDHDQKRRVGRRRRGPTRVRASAGRIVC